MTGMPCSDCCDGPECPLTLETLPVIEITGMHVSADWSLDIATCCATICFEYDELQPLIPTLVRLALYSRSLVTLVRQTH